MALTTPPPPPGYVAINCGGPAIGNFQADGDFTGGGSAISNYDGPIDRRLANPAPEEVYHSEHSGNVTYTIPHLTGTYLVRLHFREDYWDAAGKNVFNVSINDQPALTHFDIYAEAGAMYKAVIKEFTIPANDAGQIVIKLSTVTNGAKISGIEVIPVEIGPYQSFATQLVSQMTGKGRRGEEERGRRGDSYHPPLLFFPLSPLHILQSLIL